MAKADKSNRLHIFWSLLPHGGAPGAYVAEPIHAGRIVLMPELLLAMMEI